jgi:hypothetical protein
MRTVAKLSTSRTTSHVNAFSDLTALAPVILALGGDEALMETARAIQDVGRWWP